MIERLIDATVEAMIDDPRHAGLRAMLDRGFGGFRAMSDAALAREMQLRGLMAFDEPEPSDDDYEDDDTEDEDERLVLFSGLVRDPATMLET